MEDFAVVDAPDIDAGFDSTETSTESSETNTESTETEGATAETEGSSQGETAADGQPQQQGAEFKAVENGRLSAAAKATLDKLKAENPQVAKAIQRALFAEDRLRRELPGGFKEVGELRAKIEELGGDQGIQELQQETNGWREFDSLYTAGDPKVLEFLTETPEAQAAFLKIAPVAFEKYREAAPEAYGAYVAQVFVSDLVAEGIPLALERLSDFLPADNPKAQQILQQLTTYVNRIGQLSRQQPKAPAAAASPKDDQRAQQLQVKEQEFTRREWQTEANKTHAGHFGKAWTAQVGSRKLSDTQAATIKELYGLKMGAILKAKADFNKNLERYFSSGQKDGFLRYFDSVYRDAVPRALRTAFQQVIPAKPGPKPVQAGAHQQAAKPPVKPGVAAAGAGYAMVNAKPAMDSVDRTRTSTDMWLSGKAILKDGKKVQWKN